MKKFKGLIVGLLLSGPGLIALSLPAQAFVVCTGDNSFGSATTGSGTNCGVLVEGQSFSLDVTSYFPPARLSDSAFRAESFGLAILSSGGSPFSFSGVQAVVSGAINGGATEVMDAPIAVWLPTPDNPFGSATTNQGYTPSGTTFGPADARPSLAFDFGTTGSPGGFGSGKLAPDDALLNLTRVDRFLITGKLESVGSGDPLASSIVSFGIGPEGNPSGPGANPAFGRFGISSGFFTAQVPGPLPIAGAGAAFAWSRKLRRKQKQKLAAGS